MDKSIVDRFWDHVQVLGPDQCWLWTSPPNRQGYGQFWLPGNKVVQAHRFALQLTSGRDPNGYTVKHHCNNPMCCNPAHLYVVEWAQAAGGNAGQKAGRAALTEALARRIRAFLASGQYGTSQLATIFGVTPSAITQIAQRKTYAHV